MKEFLLFDSNGLNRFILKPLGNTPRFVHKWLEFNRYLLEQAKVAVIRLDEWELFIPPPNATPMANLCISVYYRPKSRPTAALNSTANATHFAGYAPQAQGDLSSPTAVLGVFNPKSCLGFGGIGPERQINGCMRLLR